MTANTTLFGLSCNKSIYKFCDFVYFGTDQSLNRFKMRAENYYAFGGGEQPLCIYQGLDGIYVSLHNKGIRCVQQLNQSQVRVIDVFEKAPSLKLGMTKTSQKLVFSNTSDHTLNYFADNKVTVTLGESEGFRDGYSPCFNSPLHITSFQENIFVCDVNNKALRLVSSMSVYKQFGRQLSAFIDLFQLDEDFAYQGAGPTLDEGIATLKDVATTMNTTSSLLSHREAMPPGPRSGTHETLQRFLFDASEVVQESKGDS